MIENIDALISKIDEYAKNSVSQSRYEHSVRTAEMSKRLCAKFGLDEKTGYLAGISHDMCKKLNEEEMLAVVSSDGFPVSELERNNTGLLHGRAAAVKLVQLFDVKDQDLLDAVAWHTFGKKNLCDLGKILYVADKIEPGRKHITEEYINDKMKLSLNEMTKTVLKENLDFLKEKGKAVAPESDDFYNSL